MTVRIYHLAAFLRSGDVLEARPRHPETSKPLNAIYGTTYKCAPCDSDPRPFLGFSLPRQSYK